jgi:hypothetical protein
MELIDRYLHAVRGYLPAREQDVIRELADDIRSQLEDREATLGRPLNKAEVHAFLQQLGHPMVLAARFRPQRHVIGSAMFPFYWRTLIVALGVALLVNVVIAAVLVASGRSSTEIVATVFRFPLTVGITVFGWVTLIFALADWALARTKILVSWDPSSLPPVRSDAPRVSRIQVAAEIVGNAAFLAWLAAVPLHPWLLFGPAAAFLETGPTWDRFYVPLVALVTTSMALAVLNLIRPDWTRLRAIARIAGGVLGLILFSLMIDSGQFVSLKPTVSGPDYREAVEVLNVIVRIFLTVAWLTSAIDLVREGQRLWRAHRQVQVSEGGRGI